MKSLHLLSLIMLTGISCQVKKASPENERSLKRSELAGRMEQSLVEETLAKWYPQCTDKEYGGYLTGYTYYFKLQGDQP